MHRIDNNDIAILILSTNNENYVEFINSIKATWLKTAIKNNIKCYFYSGGHLFDTVSEYNEICVREDDSIKNSYNKFISASNVLIKKHPNIKLIFRTNLSSYIDIDLFLKYVEKNCINIDSYVGYPGAANVISEKLYGNKLFHSIFKILDIGSSIFFFSGSGFFLGINRLKMLKSNIKKPYIDDVEIGKQLGCKRDVLEFSFPRMLITSEHKSISYLDLMNKIENDFLFHYKFKTKNRKREPFLIKAFHDENFRVNFLTTLDLTNKSNSLLSR